ncbi:RES family NAD+ phosphorylase [Roseixanthobacter liquoris]|uniref:RES family NAD+ phosphorylase n=1 Tax=Roseixanthobacter liquoris TaxID=3119921 RepID=UPI00372C79BE
MARPKSVPLPPADFSSRDLPLETIASGSRLVRIHRSELDPIYFGASARNRFDDPAKTYGVGYFSMSEEGAFAETCLRAVGTRFVQLSFLEARSFSDIEIRKPIQLVSLHGPGLAQLGATGAVSSGLHPPARQWSKAIHDHPAKPDGIAYRSNHDNGELCIALFEQSRRSLHAHPSQPIMADRSRLASLLARYKMGLG